MTGNRILIIILLGLFIGGSALAQSSGGFWYPDGDTLYPLDSAWGININVLTVTTVTINSAYSLPTFDGTANQVLKTDGSGNLSWTTSGGATLTEEQVEDYVGGMLGGTETLISVDYQDASNDIDFVVNDDLSLYDNSSSNFITATLTEEEVEDFIGGMLGGTETNISVTYQDASNDIDFVVTDAWWNALTDMVLTDNYIYVGDASNDPVGVAMSNDCTIASNGAITCDHDALDNFVANEHLDWTSDLGATNIHAGNYTDTDTTYLGGTNLTLVDTTFNVDDAFITNDASDTMVGTLTVTTITNGLWIMPDNDGMADQLLTTDGSGNLYWTTGSGLTEEQVEDYVGGMLGGTETLISVDYQDASNDIDFVVNDDLSLYDNSSSNFITATLTEEQVEDFVGGMLGGTETNISVTYQDASNDIDFVVTDAWWDALTDMVLTDTYIYVGNASNDPVGVDMTGDCSITNLGVVDCSLDISDDTNLTAGRSLTLTDDDVLADAELYTETKCIYWEDPVATDDFQSLFYFESAATITRLWCESDQTVTMTIQEDDGSPADIETTDLTCDSTPADQTTGFEDAAMAAGSRIDFAVASVASTPTWASFCFTYTLND